MPQQIDTQAAVDEEKEDSVYVRERLRVLVHRAGVLARAGLSEWAMKVRGRSWLCVRERVCLCTAWECFFVRAGLSEWAMKVRG